MSNTTETLDYYPGDWWIPCPEYDPVDAGRPWDESTEPTDPSTINWNQRQGEATIPFNIDANGWPLNPRGRTGRFGLGEHLYWGENLCADVIALAPSDTDPVGDIAVILRSDRDVWALPGGHVDPGEETDAAGLRELREETGLATTARPELVGHFLVADPRRTDNAWRVTALYIVRLDRKEPVVGGDDAKDAEWVSLGKLLTGRLDPPHIPLLKAAMSKVTR